MDMQKRKPASIREEKPAFWLIKNKIADTTNPRKLEKKMMAKYQSGICCIGVLVISSHKSSMRGSINMVKIIFQSLTTKGIENPLKISFQGKCKD
jgi:hypothetical protein